MKQAAAADVAEAQGADTFYNPDAPGNEEDDL
jgi:hypothetical protein